MSDDPQAETAPTPRDTAAQLELEAQRKPLASRASVLAGFLMLGAAIGQLVVLSNEPTVGLLQGLEPALRGLADPQKNPHIAVIEFLHHHATGAVLWGVVSGIGTALLAVVLPYMYSATLHRKPDLSRAAGRLVVVAPVLAAVATAARYIVLTSSASSFLSGHDRSHDAVQSAIQPTGLLIDGYLGLLASLALAFTVVIIALNAMRVGLLSRMMGILGIIVGVLLVIPASPLPVFQALWLISLGVLIAGGWPTGTPPAWAAGEAIPWPSAQEQREQREAAKKRDKARSDDPPAPRAPTTDAPHASSKKRKRKRR